MQVATPHAELVERLGEIGWRLKTIKFKSGQYVAVGENDQTGQEIDRVGKTPEMATAALLQYATRAYGLRRQAALKVSAWDLGDTESKKEEIAQAYAKMPPFDEKAVPAWKALAAESKMQADAIRQQIKVEVVDEPEPYMSSQEMFNDVHKNKKFKVSRADTNHPVWSVEDTINFRIVHDVLAHCQSNSDFSWSGENAACAVHFPLISPLAREALFVEGIGQSAYFSVFHGYGPKKIGLMSKFLHPTQQQNGEHVWVPHGTIPQQPEPAISTGPTVTGPGQWVPMVSPVMVHPPAVMKGFDVKTKMVSPDRPYDPNQFWVPDAQSPAVNPSADPSADYIDVVGTLRNAAKIDTEWWNEPPERQHQAVMNAFRVAILSPRKHVKWNAAHYQALMHAAPGTPAVDLWGLLEDAREQHNQGLGHDEGSHLPYKKQLDFLVHELQVENPELSQVESMREAKKTIFEKTKEFEQMLAPEADLYGWSELKLTNQARKMVDVWMKENYSPARGWAPGQLSLAGNNPDNPLDPHGTGYPCPECGSTNTEEEELLPGTYACNTCGHRFDLDDPGGEAVWHPKASADWSAAPLFDAPVEQVNDESGFASDSAKYGAFMGAHLDAIEQVGQHISAIRDVALKDIKEDGGRGLLFRNEVMNMNLPGVNPKVASFAWLLLAPMSSELGIVDTHIARGLRRDINNVTPRDYYKYERMQRALKDSTGYSHVPLGLYHWGMWDMIRNPGEHSDHSALRVLDPLPWDSPSAKWDAATSARWSPDFAGPPSFERGREAAESAAREYDQEFGRQPPNQVPLTSLPTTTPGVRKPLHLIEPTSMVRPVRV